MYGYQTLNEKGRLLKYKLFDRTPSNKLRVVTEQLQTLPPLARVLNLGCGDGVLEHLAGHDRNYRFTSVDIEPMAIQNLKQVFNSTGYPDDQAIIGDITKLNHLSAARNHYDACVSWRVLHGIHPKKHSQIFKSINTLLKNNGHLIVAVASIEDWKKHALGASYTPKAPNDCAGIMFRDFDIRRATPFPVYFFSPQDLRELGENNGFVLESIDQFQEPSGYDHLKKRPNTYLFASFVKK